MLTTKRYEYMLFSAIQVHPVIKNHRPLDQKKVEHYSRDIQQNGLLEPLIVWEKSHNEFYLVGGFHRLNAIKKIQENNPDYFERIDVRIVAGELDEMCALNLKLNADRVDLRISDYFDTIIYLKNANWEIEKIATFVDRSKRWVEDIIRYVPIMPKAIRNLLEKDQLSWAKAQNICRSIQKAPAGDEKATLQKALSSLDKTTGEKPAPKVLTIKSAKKRIVSNSEKFKGKTFKLDGDDLLSLFLILEGKGYNEKQLKSLKLKIPNLF